MLTYINDILSEELFNETILFNFKETCEKYINYHFSKKALKIDNLKYD